MAFIEIPVSNSILATYNTDVGKKWFVNRGTELDPNWFFRVPFDDGKKNLDFEINTHKSMAGVYREYIPNLPLITINTKESDERLRFILLKISEESGNGYFPVYDYCWVKESDKEQGYTIREMTLKDSIEELGSYFQTQGQSLGMGFRITLEANNYD